jgi:hypothetical protein
MSNQMERWRNDAKALESARKAMNKALALLGQVETKEAGDRSSGRLIFGLDLTASRQVSLHQAQIATAAMFNSIKAVGAVAMKLIYYRGTDECRESEWHDNPDLLCRTMLNLSCKMGQTQIARMLRLILGEETEVSAVVFVGDHSEDDPDELFELALMLKERSLPVFCFHECVNQNDLAMKAKPVFKHMAETSGGMYVEFKPDSGAVLREMLLNVAAFSAAGAEGVRQVASPQTSEARQLRRHLLLGNHRQGRDESAIDKRG